VIEQDLGIKDSEDKQEEKIPKENEEKGVE